MNVTFTYRGQENPNNRIVQINGARILGGSYRNFSGTPDRFNTNGNREFCFVIDDPEIAEALKNDVSAEGAGWNVKIKPPREEGDTPFMFLKVKVSFGMRPPAIYLETDGNMVRLDEDSIGILDRTDIAYADLDIRPYDDVMAGKPFRSAYLMSMKVVQDFSHDRFASQYNEMNNTDTLPI
jgi:hypothetical protein